MKWLLTIIVFHLSLFTFGQNVIQVKLKVNDDLQVLSDVTADEDSIPNGRYLIIYKNRTLVKGNSKDGLMSGNWTLYYPNGQQKLKAHYELGQPHGEWTLWGSQGDVQAKFQYNHGKPVGHWQGYYFNHSKAIDIVYNQKGKPIQCIQYYDDEIIALNHEYEYSNGKSAGSLSYYFENFNIFHFTQFKDDKLDGSYILYHDNGVVWEHYKYINNQLISIVGAHSKGGMPRKNDDFRNGNGVLRRYYHNGNLYSTTSYQNGLKNDSLKIYDLGGKISGEGAFKNGNAIGLWDIYSPYHKLYLTVDFDRIPNQTYQVVRTSTAPKEREEGSQKDGFRHGTWRSYDSYGELIGELNYQYGFLHGVQKHIQSNKVMQKFHFSYGNRDGKFTYYDTFGKINSEEEYKAESIIDSNWYKAPKKDWITIENTETHSHQKHLWFYPRIPGMEIIESKMSFQNKKELVFPVKRNIGYKYWPELNPAEFEGGNFAEKEYIRTNLHLPKLTEGTKINGSVLLRYKVDPLGLISEITVLKSLGYGLNQAAINVIKSFPPVNAATYNGIPINSYIVREIDFKF
jgi:antitoxin component YwqK of YwqJK toxin-antitoxin module